jgi:hypothetical protein
MNKSQSILIYGDTGATKTTQGYFLAKFLHSKYGVRGRVVGANASDFRAFEQSGLIEKGIVDYFDISTREEALGDMRKLAEGYWPRDTQAGGKGSKGYFQKNDKCITKASEWSEVGFYIIEGLTGISSLLENHIRSQEEGVGFKHSYLYTEGGYNFGGLQEGHYGLVQQELYKLTVQGFLALPLKACIFTALVGKGEDRTKETVYGPKGSGKAKTFEIPSWFEDCWHLDSETFRVKDNEGEIQEVRGKVAWFTDHPDKTTGIEYKAKIRAMPEVLPEVFKKYPKGYVRLKFTEGLDIFYKEMDSTVENYNKNGKKSEASNTT